MCYDEGMATKTTTLTIRLGPKLRNQLEQAAENREMTLGEYVRHVLQDHLAPGATR
jgi:predicted HicB family RNase H-like nuclease